MDNFIVPFFQLRVICEEIPYRSFFLSFFTFGATYFLFKKTRQRNRGIPMPVRDPPRSPDSAGQRTYCCCKCLAFCEKPLQRHLSFSCLTSRSVSGLGSHSEAVSPHLQALNLPSRTSSGYSSSSPSIVAARSREDQGAASMPLVPNPVRT